MNSTIWISMQLNWIEFSKYFLPRKLAFKWTEMGAVCTLTHIKIAITTTTAQRVAKGVYACNTEVHLQSRPIHLEIIWKLTWFQNPHTTLLLGVFCRLKSTENYFNGWKFLLLLLLAFNSFVIMQNFHFTLWHLIDILKSFKRLHKRYST